MKNSDLISLLRLIEVSGLGPTRIRLLVEEFGSPEDVFHASLRALCRVERVDIKLAQKITEHPSSPFARDQLERAKKLHTDVVTLWDNSYPDLLKKIYDPPVLLFVRGSLTGKDEDCLAIVGTRKPSPYGMGVVNNIAEGLARVGLTVVSGLARGIDTLAHKAVLRAGGRTVAVLGNGLDITYPPENRRLLPLIEDRGALVSEFPFGTKPDAGNFPRRNRIISGLSHATIVVEAGNRSGALLTAFNAVDQNREVFAVPGRLTDRMSTGCLRLIRHGAIPVESVQQIVDIVNPKLKHPSKPVQKELNLDLKSDEMKVYSVLSNEPKHVDAIVEEMNLQPSSVLDLLLRLELKDAVVQLSGKRFVRK